MQLDAFEAKPERRVKGLQGKALSLKAPVQVDGQPRLEPMRIGQVQSHIADHPGRLPFLDSQAENLARGCELDVAVALQPAQYLILLQRPSLGVAEQLLIREQLL